MEKKTLLRDKHVEYIKSLEEEVRLPICDLLLYNIRNINISLQLIIVSNYPLLTPCAEARQFRILGHRALESEWHLLGLCRH